MERLPDTTVCCCRYLLVVAKLKLIDTILGCLTLLGVAIFVVNCDGAFVCYTMYRRKVRRAYNLFSKSFPTMPTLFCPCYPHTAFYSVHLGAAHLE